MVTEKIRRPFSPKNGNERQAIESNRNHLMPLYASIGEIIDNSIQFNSKNIRINIKWKKILGQLVTEEPEEITFIDDGSGMNPEELSDCLVVGYHEDNGSGEDKMGKFGVGAVYSFLNTGRKCDMYSKTKGGEWHHAYFYLDDPIIEDTTQSYPKDATKEEPPKELKEYWSDLKSGTITIWSEVDLGHIEEDKEEISFWISRAYRKFLGDKVVKTEKNGNSWESKIKKNEIKRNIYYNDELIDRIYDPLYKIPYRDKDKKGSEKIRPIVIEFPKLDGSGFSQIKVNFGLSPKEWRKYSDVSKNASARDPINVKERLIVGQKNKLRDSSKISILRDNREVSWLHDHYLFGRYDPLDRWWGIEIEYSSDIDDTLKPKAMKFQVELSSEIRKKLKEEVASTVKVLRDTIKEDFQEDRKKEGKKKKDKEKDNGGPDYDPDDIPDSDTKETPNEFLDKLKLKTSERREILEQLSDRHFVTQKDNEKRVPKDTNLLFEYFSKGGDIIMAKYMNHPLFRKMENVEDELFKLSEKEELTSEVLALKYHELQVTWEILLQTMIISLATITPSGVQQHYIDEFLSRWGQLSRKYIIKRETAEEEEEN